MRTLQSATLVLILVLLPALAGAKDSGTHTGGSSKLNSDYGQGSNQQVQPFLRGNSGNDRKGGRYLAAPAEKRPGKSKSRATPEKVEAGSENVRRVK